MRLARIGLVFVLVLCMVLFLGPVLALGGDKGDDFAPDRLLVKFKADTDRGAKGKVHARHGGRVIGEIAALGVQVVEVPAGKAKEKVKAYKAEKAVEYVEPDYIAEAVGIPDDAYFDLQWGLHNIGQTDGTEDADIDAPEAWDITSGSGSVLIAILDTGIDQDHEDLAGKIKYNANFTTSALMTTCSGTVPTLLGSPPP